VIPRSKAKPLEVKADTTVAPVAASDTPASGTSAASTTGTSGSTTTTSATVTTTTPAKVSAQKGKSESKVPKASYGGGSGYDNEPKYWKSGTGYGHGDRKSNWDPEAQKLLLVLTFCILPYSLCTTC
jgi:hypothetical protein